MHCTTPTWGYQKCSSDITAHFRELQRSCASPALWLAITCILLGAISEESRGINQRNSLIITRTAETYVDDTELMPAVDQGNIHALAEEIQHIAKYWEQLLYTTGGVLALEKCFFVAMA
jgi:hypothetical protein